MSFKGSYEEFQIYTLHWCWFSYGISVFRESEGSFQYGHYRREADDLHAVVQHFSGENRVPSVILGHSKGVLDCFSIFVKFNEAFEWDSF